MLIRVVCRCAVFLTALLCLSCSGSPGNPSSSDASIAGTIRASAASATRIQVGVSGTALTTSSDPAGRFQLKAVPPGNVTLMFDGNGTNARLRLDNVRAGDRITIVVTVNGSTAHLDSRQDERDEDNDNDDEDQDEHEVEGRIAGFSGAAGCPIVTFTIGNTTVHTDGNTRFKDVACTALANGLKVEVEGTLANGVLLAKQIERD
jgi:hypothetical protein